MYFDSNSPSTAFLTLNGELVGCVVEADTTEGYVIQVVPELTFEPRDPAEKTDRRLARLSDWNPIASVVVTNTEKRIRRTGRVDFIGDSAKDSAEVMHANWNKIRAEIGLEPLEPLPFPE